MSVYVVCTRDYEVYEMSMNSLLSRVGIELEHRVEERARRGGYMLMCGIVVPIKAMPHDELRGLVRRLETYPGAATHMAAALPWLKAELQERGDWS